MQHYIYSSILIVTILPTIFKISMRRLLLVYTVEGTSIQTSLYTLCLDGFGGVLFSAVLVPVQYLF